RLASALETAEVAGPRTNLAFLISTLRHKAFVAGEVDTGFIERHKGELLPPPGAVPGDVLIFATLFELLSRVACANGAAQKSPWAQVDGWRVGGLRQHEVLTFADGATTRAVGVTYREKGWRIDAGDGAIDVDAAFESDGSIGASLAGRRAGARVLRIGADMVVLMRGRSFTLKRQNALDAADLGETLGNDLVAPMPGKIVQMMTKAGDRVRRGQPLAILEAMKMEHTLAAPGDLTVKAAPFRAGDQVNEGAVVISFEVEDVAT
ncbi:MAG: 3-methylcrotonyl-CoA carboxylase, partial [Alphaproteobacteria bacterium]|nr:3-methylcrotonyl-CoA carboxylase [Alphaproteobacteria bacterium]